MASLLCLLSAFLMISAATSFSAAAVLPPSPSPSPAPAPAPLWANITQILVNAGEFGTLVGLLQKTGVDVLFQHQANDTTRGISIFAPNNAAFESKRLKPLLANVTETQVKALLEYHALNQWKSLADLQHSLDNVTETFATYNSGGQYKFNISFLQGVVYIENEWNGLVQVTNTLYNSDPVSIFAIGQVLLPVDLFGPPPPPSPTPAPSPSPPSSASSSSSPSDSATSLTTNSPPSNSATSLSASSLSFFLLPALLLRLLLA